MIWPQVWRQPFSRKRADGIPYASLRLRWPILDRAGLLPMRPVYHGDNFVRAWLSPWPLAGTSFGSDIRNLVPARIRCTKKKPNEIGVFCGLRATHRRVFVSELLRAPIDGVGPRFSVARNFLFCIRTNATNAQEVRSNRASTRVGKRSHNGRIRTLQGPMKPQIGVPTTGHRNGLGRADAGRCGGKIYNKIA